MYLWVEVPAGETSVELAGRLLEHGIVVAPGSHLGRYGEGYVRFALVPSEADCLDAVALLDAVL
jgi:aspartate/methionine/tyrosine aminotransferase